MVPGIVKLLSLFESFGKKKIVTGIVKLLSLLSHPSNNDVVVYQLLTLRKVKILFKGFNNKI